MNPLRELLGLIERYSENQTLNYSSVLGGVPDRQQAHQHMMALLAQTIELATYADTDGELAKENKKLFSVLWQWCTFPDEVWTNTGHSKLEDSWMTAAKNLARTLDSLVSFPPAVSSEHIAGIRVTFEKLASEIGAHSEIPEQLANYLLYIIRRGLALCDGESVDAAALRSLSFEIAGSALSVAGVVREESRQGFFKRIFEIVRVFTPEVAVNALGSLLGGTVTAVIAQ